MERTDVVPKRPKQLFFIHLFQLFTSTGVLPNSWRTTRNTSLPKRHIRSSLQKCVLLKVLDSLVLNSIGSIKTRLSEPYQFAYKAKRSTLDAVSCLTHAINAHLDEGCKAFKAAVLGFSNAFSTLSRQGLFNKFAATNPPYWLRKWVY